MLCERRNSHQRHRRRAIAAAIRQREQEYFAHRLTDHERAEDALEALRDLTTVTERRQHNDHHPRSL